MINMITRKELTQAADTLEKQLDNMGYDILVKLYSMYDGRIGCGFYQRVGGKLILATGTGSNTHIYNAMYQCFNQIVNNPMRYK